MNVLPGQVLRREAGVSPTWEGLGRHLGSVGHWLLHWEELWGAGPGGRQVDVLWWSEHEAVDSTPGAELAPRSRAFGVPVYSPVPSSKHGTPSTCLDLSTSNAGSGRTSRSKFLV